MASEEEKKEDSVYDEDGREKPVLYCSYNERLWTLLIALIIPTQKGTSSAIINNGSNGQSYQRKYFTPCRLLLPIFSFSFDISNFGIAENVR